MPTVSDFITNDLTNPPAVPRELQALVDKVMSRSSMMRGEREAAANVASSALSGIASQQIARRGLLEGTRMTEAGLTSRLGLTGPQEMEQTRLKEAAATERAGVTAKPGLITAIAEAKPITPLLSGVERTAAAQGLGVTRPTPPPISPPPEKPVSWWEKNKEKMFNY